MTPNQRNVLVGGTLAACLPLAALILVVPMAFSLHVPLVYGGDGLSHAVLVRTVLDVGWFPSTNPRLGAPFGATSFDYPLCDAANLILLKLFGWYSGDWVVATNLFFFATFVLCSLCAFFVMQRLGLHWSFAAVGATLFAVLPYHFLRPQHLLLVAYWSVPLSVYLALACGPNSDAGGSLRPIRSMFVLALLAVAIGSGGVYYAFFGVALIVTSGVANVVAQRRWRAMMPALVASVVVVSAMAVELAPSLRYWQENGRNTQVGERVPAEAEYNAFKPIQLFLPQSKHRIESMREAANRYAASAPMVNENATAALGIVGAVGLVLILVHGLRRVIAQRPLDPPLESLTLQAAVALALGTLGGAGSIIAYAGFTSLRAYNRVSVFLGFIGIAAVLLLMQRWLRRIADARRRAIIAGAAAIALLGIGALDQLPAISIGRGSASFESDRNFFTSLEQQIPTGTAVYQLPYHPYPEAGRVNAMDDYGLARGYLHTKTLRWSYGAMKGRPGDEWLRLLSERDLDDQLDLAARSGFGAVHVDRRAYDDHGAAVESDLRRRLGPPIVQGANGLDVAYRMRPTGEAPVAREALLPETGTPIGFDRPQLSARVARIAGFTVWEPAGRWTEGPLARIELLQPLPRRFSLRLTTIMAMPANIGVELPIRIDGVERRVRVGGGPTTIDIPFDISGSANAIEITIPTPTSFGELNVNADTRKLGILVKSIAILPDAGN
jgi:phosphoglycerol transferase